MCKSVISKLSASLAKPTNSASKSVNYKLLKAFLRSSSCFDFFHGSMHGGENLSIVLAEVNACSLFALCFEKLQFNHR